MAKLRDNRGPREHHCPHGRFCGIQACAECGSEGAVQVKKAVTPLGFAGEPLPPPVEGDLDAILTRLRETNATGRGPWVDRERVETEYDWLCGKDPIR